MAFLNKAKRNVSDSESKSINFYCVFIYIWNLTKLYQQLIIADFIIDIIDCNCSQIDYVIQSDCTTLQCKIEAKFASPSECSKIIPMSRFVFIFFTILKILANFLKRIKNTLLFVST